MARLPELTGVEHLQVRSALRRNNRVEQAHQPTRLRERVMPHFKCSTSAQHFLDAFSRVCNLFRPRRHLLRAAAYRATMRDQGATWREVAGCAPPDSTRRGFPCPRVAPRVGNVTVPDADVCGRSGGETS